MRALQMQTTQELPDPPHQADEQTCDGIDLLGTILDGHHQGRGNLPSYLGLTPLSYVLAVKRHIGPELHDEYLQEGEHAHRQQLRQELLELRRDEWGDVRELLLQHRAGASDVEVVLADIVAAGCLASDHLWRDLALPSRTHLNVLLGKNFPSLFSLNVQDMKWKKFFYRQLCEQEGAYVCRSPSCESCHAWDDCFGSEE